MAITFVAASANAAAASGDLSVTPPTTQTDDIMILAVTSHDNVAVTLPAGWTIYQAGNNTTAMRSTLAWKRAVGAEGAFTVTHTAGDGIVANVAVFRGCITDATVINASGLTHNASSSTCTATGITTTVAGAMILFTMHDSDNGASSAQAATDPATLTERFDNASTLGLDEAVSGATALQGSQGATGNATGTLSLGPDVNSGGLTALKPGASAFTQTLTASMSTFAGSTTRLTSHFTSASMSTFSGLLDKASIFGKTLTGGMSTFSGSISEAAIFGKSLTSGMSTFSGANTKQTGKVLDAGMSTFGGSQTRQTSHILSASMSTFSGATTTAMLFARSFAASMSTFSALINKAVQKSLDASMGTFSGVLSELLISGQASASKCGVTLKSLWNEFGFMFRRRIK